MVKTLISVARSQLGTREGSNGYTKYGAWYDSSFANSAWCAMFVSWCANQASIPTSVIPKHASCDVGANWFRNKGIFQLSRHFGGNYAPKAGDIIYFSNKSNQNDSTHVGIVISSDGNKVYTIEELQGTIQFKRTDKNFQVEDQEVIQFANWG